MSHDSSRHLTEEEIERYSLGDNHEEVRAPFEEHFLICESCQLRLAETDAYLSSMRLASAQLRGQPRRRQWWNVWNLAPALAGMALLLLAAVLGFVRTNTDRGTPAAFALSLQATRGAGVEAKAPAGRPLILRPDLEGLPASSSYRLEIVDRVGKRLWQGVVPGAAAPSANTPPVPAGVYFVRLYAPAGELLREYALETESRR
jgi:hypothetical protein